MSRSIVQLNNEVCHFRSFFNKIIEVKTCGGEPGVVLKVGIINVLSLSLNKKIAENCLST